jgi:hypothetical protein
VWVSSTLLESTFMKTCGAHSTPFVRRSSTLGVNLQAQGYKQPPTTTAESSTLVSIDEENACESELGPEGDYVSGADLEESRMLEGTSFGQGDGWVFGSPPSCKKETSALSLLSASAVVLAQRPKRRPRSRGGQARVLTQVQVLMGALAWRWTAKVVAVVVVVMGMQPWWW